MPQFLAAWLLILTKSTVLLIVAYATVAVLPQAQGSGLPKLIAYLNGCKIPFFASARVLIAKILSTAATTTSSLFCGPEGPIIHMGACVGKQLVRALYHLSDLKPVGFFGGFARLRHDREQRDFVAIGAGAGVAAAFYAPISGTLFVVEEASSYFSLQLLWSTFSASMVAMYVTHALLRTAPSSSYLSVGSLEDECVQEEFEMVLWILLVSVFAGLFGSAFTSLAMAAQRARQMFPAFATHTGRLMELVVISSVSTTIRLLTAELTACKPMSLVNVTGPFVDYFSTYGCEEKGTFNPMATLNLQPTHWAATTLLMKNEAPSFTPGELFCSLFIWMLLAPIGVGLAPPVGIMLPLITIGAMLGRLIAEVRYNLHVYVLLLPADPKYGIFALMGATAMMAGTGRIRLFLTMVMLEITQEICVTPLIATSAIVGVAVGSFFTSQGLYHALIDAAGLPYLSPRSFVDELEHHADVDRRGMKAGGAGNIGSEVGADVRSIRSDEIHVGSERATGSDTDLMTGEPTRVPAGRGSGKGTDVGTEIATNGQRTSGAEPLLVTGKADSVQIRLHEVMSATIVTVLIGKTKEEALSDISGTSHNGYPVVDSAGFIRGLLLRHDLTDRAFLATHRIDEIMDRSPCCVHKDWPIERAHRLFATLGLRHLVVMNETYSKPVGMITRHDLQPGRWRPRGSVSVRWRLEMLTHSSSDSGNVASGNRGQVGPARERDCEDNAGSIELTQADDTHL